MTHNFNDFDTLAAHITAEADRVIAAFGAVPTPEPDPEPDPDPTPEPEPVEPTEHFTIRDGRIYDPSGNEFIPLGMNVGYQGTFDWRGDARGHSDDALAWGFNTVKTNFVSTVPYPWDYPAPLPIVDEIIREYTAKRIVVQIVSRDSQDQNASGNPADYHLPGVADAWRQLADKYKDNPYVWFNLSCEPHEFNDDWVNMHQTLIDAVRSTGAKNPIVIDPPVAGQDVGRGYQNNQTFLELAPRLKNHGGIINGVHTYGWPEWQKHTASFEQYVDANRAAGYPVIVGEAGFTADGTTTAGAYDANRTAWKTAMQVARTRGIGIVAWHGTHGDMYSTQQSGNAFWEGKDGHGLSEMGRDFRDLIAHFRNNPDPEPEPEPDPEPTPEPTPELEVFAEPSADGTTALVTWETEATPSAWRTARDGVDSHGAGPWSYDWAEPHRREILFTRLIPGREYTFTITNVVAALSASVTVTMPVPPQPDPPTDPAPEPEGNIVWRANIDGAPVGRTSAAAISGIFGPTFATSAGVINNTEIVNVAGQKVMRQHLPAGSLGSLIASPKLPRRLADATISFDLRLDPGMEIRHGFKAGAGLVGVRPGAGIYDPTSGKSRDTGASLRIMVHGSDGSTRPFQGALGPLPPGTDNEVVTYIYARNPDGSRFSGFGHHAKLGTLVKGQWHNVKIRGRMNTPGRRDGIIQFWLDGDLRFEMTDADLRGSDSSILWDAVLWDTHRGGGATPNWLSSRNGYLDVRNVTVTG